MLIRLFISAAAFSSSATAALGQDQPAPRAAGAASATADEGPDLVQEECRRLVKQLGAADFGDREAAARRLADLGPTAYEALEAEYHATDDYEIRLRIQEVVRGVFFQDQLLGRLGFLGVGPETVGSSDPRVKEGHTGIVIRQVVEDTAADRAELRINDLIVSIDGHFFEGIISQEEFSVMIREAGPGRPLTLGVYRGRDFFTAEVILGQRPIERYFSDYDGTYVEMLLKTEERFVRWWEGKFGLDADSEPDTLRSDRDRLPVDVPTDAPVSGGQQRS